MNVYYILRDRIPFYLSIIWLYRWRIDTDHMKKYPDNRRTLFEIPVLDLIGYYLIAVTGICLVGSMILLLAGETFMPIFNFRWSFPSPITWGLLTLAGTYNLSKKRFTIFESYYLSFMTAISGGWTYEVLRGVPYWVRSNYAYWNWIKFNLSKVFLFEFQVFCFPIVLYLLMVKYKHKISKEIIPLLGLVVVWYFYGLQLQPFYHQLGSLAGNTYYSWIMRLPMALFLYAFLDEVRK